MKNLFFTLPLLLTQPAGYIPAYKGRTMKTQYIKFLFLIALANITTLSQATAEELSTKNHSIVCKMDDITGTNYFVDLGATWDQTTWKQTGKLSSKVVEMPTMNAYAYNNKKFQVQLISVSRTRCMGCEHVQEISFISVTGANDVVNKLSISKDYQATITYHDLNGQKNPYVPATKGACTRNSQ